jgi:hypothetical protein
MKKVPYYIKLRKIIPSLGFNSSTEIFRYLRQCNINFMYDRINTTEDRIPENIEEFSLIAKGSFKVFGRGFIFVMDDPNTNRIDMVHLQGISKIKLIKYLRLKAFS